MGSTSDETQARLSTQAGHTAAQGPLPAIVRLRHKGEDKVLVSQRLSQGRLTIGAGAQSDWVIEDAAVSRQHLEVELVADGVRIKDLGSRNGTFYLGQRLGEMQLSLGSRVTLGESELEFAVDRDDFEGTQSAGLIHYGPLWGASSSMVRLFSLLKRLEGSLVNVLIEGESGTGKELIARALHDHSEVKAGPFVALNCGAMDRALVRSELFGHKKGAFTGAQSDSLGAFLEADGGTLFLDEIGELPLDIQPVLLRTLESRSVARVGESKARPVQVRVIAATHRNLKEDVKDGLFRADLYYRLMVVQLSAPPLRQRREDIPLLAEHICRAEGLPLPGPGLITALTQRSFPGNVRELKHALMAYSAVGELPAAEASDVSVAAGDLASFIDPEKPYAEQKEALVDRMTFLYLQALIDKTSGNRSEAARVAGLQRGYLRRLLQKYGLAGDGDED